uniref:LAGLIDADG endonuclease n=1 Tax=Juglanconis oblonga TaxID=1940568 RepID=A0A291LIQ7_9PEZI|nr:LAGLIDADG endonuclease [Juglanconis oblonga]ATI20366.1 LAGLIDADG endonuclease [Juglanconis oblonga]
MYLNYSLTLHNFLYAVGYCSPDAPIISKQLGKKSRLYKTMRFTTWTYTSFDWIYDMWYKNNVKIVPGTISEFLTPLALAIWVMDSGVKVPLGLSFYNCFTLSECELLVRALHKNFGLKVIIYNKGIPSQYCIYIPKESMICLRDNISNYVIPGMKYKLLD